MTRVGLRAGARRRRVAAGLAACPALALAGCSSGQGGLDTTPVTAPSIPIGVDSGTPQQLHEPAPATSQAREQSGEQSGEQAWAEVDLGPHRRDPVAKAFARYAVARERAALAYDATLPAFVDATAARWRRAQGRTFDDLRARGWSVPRPARWAVQEVRRSSDAATVRVCGWGPSLGFVDAATGQPVEDVESRWYPFEFSIVRSRGTWIVAGTDDSASYRCEVAS